MPYLQKVWLALLTTGSFTANYMKTILHVQCMLEGINTIKSTSTAIFAFILL